jgi:hypothetical protein
MRTYPDPHDRRRLEEQDVHQALRQSAEYRAEHDDDDQRRGNRAAGVSDGAQENPMLPRVRKSKRFTAPHDAGTARNELRNSPEYKNR